MKRNYIISLYFVTLLALCGCEDNTVSSDIDSGSYATMDINERETESPPGIIPPENDFFHLSMDTMTTWGDYDMYYRETILVDKSISYFRNLQWSSISEMIQYTDFLDEAEVSVKKYYLEEMFARDFINEPAVAHMLIGSLGISGELSSEKVMFLCGQVIKKNKEHLTPENFTRHYDRHKAYYQMLEFGGGL